MSNFFEDLGKKVVNELVHTATDAVTEVAKHGAELVNDALRGKEKPPVPPKMGDDKA